MAGLTGGGGDNKMLPFMDPIRYLLTKPKVPEAAAAPAAVTPVVEAPPVMPIADDDAVKAAKRRSIAKQMQRTGRQSTILSQVDDVTSVETLG